MSERLDHERALERDAVQFTKDFSLFVLRTCVLLHGGAIVALISLLGAIVGHPDAAPVISLRALRFAILIFAVGLVATVVAGVCGYFNFLAGQARDVSQQTFVRKLSIISATRFWATVLTIASLVLFIAGVATVAIPW